MMAVVILNRLDKGSSVTLAGLLALNAMAHLLWLMAATAMEGDDCGTRQSLVILTSILWRTTFLSFLGFVTLAEIASTVLFIVVRNVGTAVITITMAWSVPILLILGQAPTVVVLLFAVLPLTSILTIPTWRYSSRETRGRGNPLPGAAYSGQ